jgi:hypothetical protein
MRAALFLAVASLHALQQLCTSRTMAAFMAAAAGSSLRGGGGTSAYYRTSIVTKGSKTNTRPVHINYPQERRQNANVSSTFGPECFSFLDRYYPSLYDFRQAKKEIQLFSRKGHWAEKNSSSSMGSISGGGGSTVVVATARTATALSSRVNVLPCTTFENCVQAEMHRQRQYTNG